MHANLELLQLLGIVWTEKHWNEIMETMTALGTVGAVIVALWLARKDSKEQIRLEQSTDYAPGDEGNPEKIEYDLYVVNEGRIEVTITRFVGVILFLHSKPFTLFAYERKGTGNHQDKPKISGIIRLKSGEFLTLLQTDSGANIPQKFALHLSKWHCLPEFILSRICKIGVETTKSRKPTYFLIKKEALEASIFRAKKIAKCTKTRN